VSIEETRRLLCVCWQQGDALFRDSIPDRDPLGESGFAGKPTALKLKISAVAKPITAKTF